MIPFQVSQVGKLRNVIVREHLIHRIRHPDPGSDFEQVVKRIWHLSDDEMIQTLLNAQYDGFIFVGEESREVVGDIYFQVHASEVRMFSIWVRADARHHGVGTHIMSFFLRRILENRLPNRVYLGKAGDAWVLDFATKFVAGTREVPGIRGVAGEQPWDVTLLAA